MKAAKPTKSLKHSAVAGAFWSALSTVFSRGLRFMITIFLARVLAPEDFGLIAMSMVVIDVAEMLRDLGLGAALIQRKQLDPEHLTTCFWANMGIGLSLWAITTAISPLAADFYRNPSVAPILRVMALNFLISPFGSIPWVMLNRQLRFRELMIAQSVATAIRGGASLLLAFKGFGVWSLVWGPIAGNLAGAVINEWFCRWQPKFAWSQRHFMDLFHFGKNIFGERLLGYFAGNSSFLITGRFLGAEIVGFYNFAYQIPHLAETQIVPVVGRVLLPVLSQVQDDHERLRRGYLQSLRWIAAVCAPFAAGLCVVAPEFVHIVYGQRWTPVVVPLQILCLAGFVHALTNTVWTVQQAVGRSDIGFKWNAATLPFIIGGLIASARWGMLGIALVMTLMSVVLAIAIQHITNRLIGLSWRRWLATVRAPVLSSALMAGITALLRLWLLSRGPSTLVLLLATTIAGTFTLILFLFMLDRTMLDDLLHIFDRRKAPVPQPAFEPEPGTYANP